MFQSFCFSFTCWLLNICFNKESFPLLEMFTLYF